jgi:hypothetical protein
MAVIRACIRMRNGGEYHKKRRYLISEILTETVKKGCGYHNTMEVDELQPTPSSSSSQSPALKDESIIHAVEYHKDENKWLASPKREMISTNRIDCTARTL